MLRSIETVELVYSSMYQFDLFAFQGPFTPYDPLGSASFDKVAVKE